jgi:PPE-repeat protein
MAENKQGIGTIIKKWSTETLLISIIVGGIFGYSELKAYIQLHTFSTPEIKVLSEDFIQKNLGIAGRVNLDAQNELTEKYKSLTIAIDTLGLIYNKSYESMDIYKQTNQAILQLVHHTDSISTERLKMLKELAKEASTQSNATQLSLNGVSDIKKILTKTLEE